jgi:hypothetical protein
MTDYLAAPVKPSRYTWLLIALGLYQAAGGTPLVYQVFAGLLVLAGVALVRRWRRGLAYGCVAALAIVATGQAVFVEANGPHDASANRDEAAEFAAKAFVAGVSPWGDPAAVGGNVTTGPASVLITTPFVSAFGRINELSFVFWLGFLAFLAWGDLTMRNGSFLDLALFYSLGQFEIVAAQYWSLEELYYPHLLLAVAFLAIARQRYVLAGALLALSVLCRTNYLFLVVGFLAWVSVRERDRRWLRSAATGALLGLAGVLFPFVLRGGYGVLADYVRVTAAVGGQELVGGVLMTLPARATAATLGPTVGSAVTALAVMTLVFWTSRRLPLMSNPFPCVAVGAFAAQTLAWYPSRAQDYTLMFVVPALFAIAWGDSPEDQVFADGTAALGRAGLG